MPILILLSVRAWGACRARISRILFEPSDAFERAMGRLAATRAFLGDHFTKMIDGSVHAGPNAVLAFRREGYSKTDFNLRDFVETMTFGGFWKLARKNLGEGMKEIYRSFSKAAFVRSLQQLIPEVQSADLVPCKAGVRAQALRNDRKLVDDFLMIKAHNALHVCNALSPAATGSLEIGRAIVEQIPSPASKTTVALSQ